MRAPGNTTRRRWLRISLYVTAGFVLGVAVIAAILISRFQPIARHYFVSTLEKRYQSDVELGNLQLSLFPTVHAVGDNLVLWFNGDHSGPPLVRLRRFTVDADLFNFFRTPKHIARLRLEGLRLHPPPRSDSASSAQEKQPAGKHPPAVPFILDEVIADGTTLETTPNDPGKAPLIFEIQRLTLHTVGLGQPMTFHAELTNPKPPGLIHTDGRFGPWNVSEPVDTPVSAVYTFRNADLSVFKGITGILSSDGQFKGELDRIEVRGTTDTPDFSLKTGGHPMPLHTDFQATVDGTNGNTVLHPVHARLGHSEFDVEGAIDRGALETHKTILLRASAKDQKGHPSRLEDFLRLSVKDARPPMTGGISFSTKVKIPPGETEVIGRLELDGTFALDGVKFTSSDVQDKLASLSHRAQGDPTNHDPDVSADFEGGFHLRRGLLSLPDLRFHLPGASVNMAGSYALRTGDIDFKGTAKLRATVSQMTTGWKSKLLSVVDPLFSHDGAGTVIPISIGGTRGDPSFRLDIGRLIKR